FFVLTGCAAQIEPETFAAMAEVDHVFGNAEKLEPEPYAQLALGKAPAILVDDIMKVRQTAGHLVGGFGARTRAFVEVQNGCDHRCTFCIIPFGRGPSRSVPMGAVVEQIRTLVGEGHAEIVLTGVDITSYGADLPGRPSLGALVQSILAHVPDLARLRLSSIDSVEADEALFEALGEPRVMPHLHLSLQAGDDMILKRMKRRHSVAEAEAFCRRARSLRPDIVFGADIIAGFPTETDAMFENTLAHIEACGLTYLHVFPFSPRPGTPAAKMPQTAKARIKARARALRARGRMRHEAFLVSQMGQSRSVLVERPHQGRSEHFAEMKLSSPQVPGELIAARVMGREGLTLVGDRIQ
ncbi:tRNA t(6)A37-methylthiotransferase, partial [hydrothermal vent metagenome]